MLFENPVSVAQQRFSTMNPRQSADKDCKMNGGAMARDEDWPSGLLWGFLLWRVFIVFFFYGFFRARTDRSEPRRRVAHEASSFASAICGEGEGRALLAAQRWAGPWCRRVSEGLALRQQC